MKKIFTLIAAAMTAMAAWADAPQLLFGNQVADPDKTYETGYTSTVVEIVPGVMSMTVYMQDSDLSVRAENGSEITVELKASEHVQFCGIDGKCVQGEEITKTGTIFDEDDSSEFATAKLEIDLSTNDWEGIAPDQLLHNITLEVKTYYSDSPEEYAYAKVVMTNKSASAGISDITIDADSQISLTGNTLNYNVEEPTKLAVYNVNGGLVLSRTVAAEGSLSLDSLHAGVYIYSLGAKSGKILVRK